MPSTYRSNISWKTKKQHADAKQFCDANDESLSEHIQKHFDRAIRRKK